MEIRMGSKFKDFILLEILVYLIFAIFLFVTLKQCYTLFPELKMPILHHSSSSLDIAILMFFFGEISNSLGNPYSSSLSLYFLFSPTTSLFPLNIVPNSGNNSSSRSLYFLFSATTSLFPLNIVPNSGNKSSSPDDNESSKPANRFTFEVVVVREVFTFRSVSFFLSFLGNKFGGVLLIKSSISSSVILLLRGRVEYLF